jgi:hypothetical protein
MGMVTDYRRVGDGDAFNPGGKKMGLLKKTLLGTGAALVSGLAAQAADLPVAKAAPVEYVRVCDAYGAGFFFIPGTQTCLRIGGRVRADYAFVPAQTTFEGITNAGVPIVDTFADTQHTLGWEARGRISFDARTRTPWGTVQAVALLRLNRTNGILTRADITSGSATTDGPSTGTTLENAYIRFAGFTFGAARDNFAMMPSISYGAGHWGSFANGAKQIAYTATFGGGFSATIALQDHQDTSVEGADGTSNTTGFVRYVHNTIPQVNARLEWAQGWGTITVAGAVANVAVNDRTDTFDVSETVWAVGAAVRVNLPMLARGSALWLHAAYADGMTEYTTNWTSFKSSAYRRDVGGFTMNHPSYVFEDTGGVNRIETVKSWNLAAALVHFWTPQYRSQAWVSYGQLDAPATAKSFAWNGDNSFGDATVFNIGTNFAWLPTANFEIGVEVIYARVSQDVRSPNGTVFGRTDDNVTGRLRVERNF